MPRFRPTQRSKRDWSVTPLEPRLMLAADVPSQAPAPDSGSPAPAQQAPLPAELSEAIHRTTSQSVVFIDTSVKDYQVLNDSALNDAEVVLIDHQQDGVRQITEHLKNRKNVESIHIVTHGSEGKVQLGRNALTPENLGHYADQLRSWSDALTSNADILLYGCESGKGGRGQQLISGVSRLTGADVAASDDITGRGADGRDWELERSVGDIEAATPFSQLGLASYQHHLALPSYSSFNSADDLELNGNAILTGGELRLVGAQAQQRGSTYYTTPMSVDSSTSFEASFSARMDGGQGSAGGEGLAFVIQNSPAGVDAQNIGNYPGGLDYNALPKSIGIELDTFKNVYEQWADEVTITMNGVLVTPVATIQSPYDLNNGDTYHVWVEYDGDSDLLSVYLSDTTDKPQAALLTANIELDEVVGDQAYLGFAAATGQAFNNTYIESWNVIDTTVPPAPNPGNFVLASDTIRGVEDSGQVTLTVSRVGGSSGAASVSYRTLNDSAQAGDDYDSTTGTLQFADGETSKSVQIDLIDDADIEGTESFRFELTSSTGAGLLTPDTATINIIDDDALLPVFSSFNSSDGLQLNGDAVITGDELRLVSAQAQQRGSTYYTTPLAVDSDTSFQASFAARMDGGQGSAGGEGLAFVIQNSPSGVFAQNNGNYSGGLDYNALPNSIGIELDTFKNSYEQWADEITITVNGVLVTPVATVQSPFDLNNGDTYHVWVDYDGESDLLSVYLSDTATQPQTAVVTANLQLDTIVGDQAYFGFGAATGNAFNNTYIESWNVTADSPQPPDTGNFVVASEFVGELEGNGSVTLDILRVGGSSGAASVNYITSDISASEGVDYVFETGTLNFADGETRRSVTIDLIDDSEIEDTESFTLELVGSVGAGLQDPGTTTVSILDDDTALPNYQSFESATGLQLNGDAQIKGDRLRLVASRTQERGSAYFTSPISIDSNTSFQTSFAARFSGIQGSDGGEGLAFVIQNSPSGAFAQSTGGDSGGLNYEGLSNSIAIELDTFQNAYEQWADEISITINGDVTTPVATIDSPFDLNDGDTYHVWVDYDGDSNLLSVFLSLGPDKPLSPVLTANVALDQILGNQAYVGFSASTGTDAFNKAYINSWNFSVDSSGTSDPGDPGNFVIDSEYVSAVEDSGSVTLSISRIGGSDGSATVDYVTYDNDATGGVDYVSSAQRLAFADGETNKSVTIDLIDDAEMEGTESFSFRLASSEGAGLLAPRTATVNIIDDDTALPAYSSFDSSADLELNGNAVITGGELRLVAATAQQRGSTYYTTPLSVDADTSFQASFAARFDGGQGSAGGEGLAFVIQNSPAGVDAQNTGNYSGGLDYNALPNSIGIELDTFQNSYEQWADEITITTNGVLVTPVETIQSPYDLNNGDTYHVWVDYNGESDSLAVYVSDSDDKPAFALIKATIELDQIVGDQAYVGFAAATGTAFNNTYIESWSVTLDVPDPNPDTFPNGVPIEVDLVTGLNQPLALKWSPDGRNMYIAEKGGVVKVVRDGGPAQTLIDISHKVNEQSDRGLIGLELHPDFENNPYIYLAYTVDPPEVYDNIGDAYAEPDGRGNRAGQLIRLTVDASSNYTTVDMSSEVILLGSASTWDNFNGFTDSTLDFTEPPAGQNPDGTYVQDFVNSDSRSHTIGSLAFGLDGNLFVSIGDGASFNQTDVRALRVQDIDSLSGKVLRIDPLTGQGISDNPFYNGDPDANRSKVYHYGLRNPWRLAVDSVSGRLYIGDTGLGGYEEINTGDPGSNFGWPFYEGGQGVNVQTPSYKGLAASQTFYASGEVAIPGLIALAHGPGTDVVALGTVVNDSALGPLYDGDVFYNDFARGTVRHADVADDGTLLGINIFATGAEFVVDIQQGPDGWLYYVNLVEGTVGRWDVV